MIKFVFKKITNTREVDFTDIYTIYLQSFPDFERRNLESLVKNINSKNRFQVLAIYINCNLVGFINYWRFDTFLYIEHFAIKDEFRNREMGSESLKLFLKDSDLPVILEVEIASSDLASRRIRFYEKLGFVLLTNEYLQPPYDGISTKIPMHLMCNDLDFGKKHFELIKNVLYKEVYNFNK